MRSLRTDRMADRPRVLKLLKLQIINRIQKETVQKCQNDLEHLLIFKPRKEVNEPAAVEVKLVIVSPVVLE